MKNREDFFSVERSRGRDEGAIFFGLGLDREERERESRLEREVEEEREGEEMKMRSFRHNVCFYTTRV